MSMKLKNLRTRSGITQQTMAEKIGVSQQTIARWESGASPIPSKYLKDLAVLFGGSVGDFIDDVPAAGKKVISLRRGSDAAADRNELPYGTVTLRFEASTGSGKSCEYSYPVTTKERERLMEQIEVADDPNSSSGALWLQFESLDNRWVAVNAARLEAVTVRSDEVEAMPNYLHHEVYKAARDVVMENLPNNVKPTHDDAPYSEQLIKTALSFIANIGGNEQAMNVLEGMTYEFASGDRQKCVPDDIALRTLDDAFRSYPGDTSPYRLFEINSMEFHQSTYVRLGSLRLIEASRLRMAEVRTTE